MLLILPVILLGVFLYLAFGPNGEDFSQDFRFSRPDISRPTLLLALFCALPTFIYLGLTWNQEFPFAGDHDHHFWAHQLFHTNNVHLVKVGGLASLVFLIPKIEKKYLGILSFLILCAGSFYFVNPNSLVRYPAVSYILSIPIKEWFKLVESPNPLNGIRLFEALSIPVWIICLRPIFIRNQKSRWVLLVGALLFWQKDVIYYFSSSYLEPWSIIFVLLAMERLFFGRSNREKIFSCYLVGAAALFKENAILFLPFCWMGSQGWKQGKFGVRVFVISVLPFLVYYAIRVDYNIARSFSFMRWKRFIAPIHFSELGFRQVYQYGWATLILLGMFQITLLFQAFKSGSQFWERLCFPFFLGITLFYFSDHGGANYTGLPRFFIWALLPLSACYVQFEKKEWILRMSIAILLLCQLVMLPKFIKNAFGSSLQRSYFEHYESPVYYPVDQLLRKVQSAGGFEGMKAIDVNQSKFIPRVLVMDRVYPKWSKVFPFKYLEGPCVCSTTQRGLMAFFHLKVGLWAMNRKPPRGSRKREDVLQCFSELKASCSQHWEIIVDGQLTGIFGRL